MSPIRTDSRRNAALRAFLDWPLRSWRHAAFAAIMLTGLLVLAAVVLAPDQRALPPRPVARPAPAAPVAPPPRPAVNPDVEQVTGLGERTAAAWVNHPGNDSPIPPPADPHQFAEQFKALADEEFYTRLQTIAPENIPEDRVTGAPRVSPPSGEIAFVLVPVERRTVDQAGAPHTEPMLLSITAVRTPEGWRVNRIDAKPGQ